MNRFVMRSLAPQITIGGGTVLDTAPTGRRPEPGWLEALESGETTRIIPLLLARSPRQGMTTEDLSLSLNTRPADLSLVLEKTPGVSVAADYFILSEELEAAKGRLLAALERKEKERPERPELTIAEARTALGLEMKLADALLQEWPDEIRVSDSGVGLRSPNEVPPELEEEASLLYEKLRRAGTEPPTMEKTPAVRLLLKRE